MFKKGILIVVALFTAFLVTACGSPGGEDIKPGAAQVTAAGGDSEKHDSAVTSGDPKSSAPATPSPDTISPDTNQEQGKNKKDKDSVSSTASKAASKAASNTASNTTANAASKTGEADSKNTGPESYTCTLSVRCDAILANMGKLNPEKAELLPKDGVIYPAQKVEFFKGETVFNVLQREMKGAKIHMEFVNTPVYNSAYIKGINNIYECDCGELSGWTYKVNGALPDYGSSRYELQPGDVVEILYTCDLGRDAGGGV